MIEKAVRISFRVMAAFWILSPVTFLVARLTGVYNFRYDVAVFAALSLISFVTMFFAYSPDQRD